MADIRLQFMWRVLASANSRNHSRSLAFICGPFIFNGPLARRPPRIYPLPPMNQDKRRQIFERLRAANPTPTTELNYATPFELLVAVILSAQATDKGVNKATARLFPVANTPAAILALGEEGLRQHIRTIGLFNSKAKNIIAACRILVDQHGGEVPRDRMALEALPGVGRKTANVVLSTAFDEPTMPVDTHIFRVANRTRIATGKTPLAVEQALLRRVPRELLKDAHHWLILHGRYVCTARRPRCPGCLIRDLCEYRDKTPEPIVPPLESSANERK